VINRNQIIRQADDDGVPAATVERDYVLSHVLAAIADCEQAERIVFKGGTALRLCYFEDYRYSADLDFSLIGGLDPPGALHAIGGALAICGQALGLPALSLTDATPPRIEYTGPLGRARTLKLDLADDELVENTTRRPIFQRYSDQAEADCLAYMLEEAAAEKLRCVIQRLQCRDLYDIHELFVVRGLDPSFVWPLFERKARHRQLDSSLFPTRFEERLPQYKARWTKELSDHVPGEPPQFEALVRAVRRALRDSLQAVRKRSQ
jgi:predicted nucleotidyltransferase component of viral defense system